MADLIQISSIITARDEEKNISRCIESQLAIVDDIVVLVDSRTKDATLQIASSYPNVNCEVVGWNGYAKTKIYAVSKTKYDWVFWIDADEELTTELIEELKRFKTVKPHLNAYDVARRAFFLGKWIKHSGWYPSRVTRLFNKKVMSFNEKEVHEHLNVVARSDILIMISIIIPILQSSITLLNSISIHLLQPKNWMKRETSWFERYSNSSGFSFSKCISCD